MFERQDTNKMNTCVIFHIGGHIQSSSKGKFALDMQRAFCDMGEHKLRYLVWEVIMNLGNINCMMCQN